MKEGWDSEVLRSEGEEGTGSSQARGREDGELDGLLASLAPNGSCLDATADSQGSSDNHRWGQTLAIVPLPSSNDQEATRSDGQLASCMTVGGGRACKLEREN